MFILTKIPCPLVGTKFCSTLLLPRDSKDISFQSIPKDVKCYSKPRIFFVHSVNGRGIHCDKEIKDQKNGWLFLLYMLACKRLKSRNKVECYPFERNSSHSSLLSSLVTFSQTHEVRWSETLLDRTGASIKILGKEKKKSWDRQLTLALLSL